MVNYDFGFLELQESYFGKSHFKESNKKKVDGKDISQGKG